MSFKKHLGDVDVFNSFSFFIKFLNFMKIMFGLNTIQPKPVTTLTQHIHEASPTEGMKEPKCCCRYKKSICKVHKGK